MTSIDESRQSGIIKSENLEAPKVIIIGAGAGGSWATYFLAKMGISNIDLYDFDTVGEENIRAQCFGLKDIGKKKTDSLKARIKEELGLDISIYDKVEATTTFNLTMNTIVLNLVDKIEVRKMIYDKLKGLPIYMIDARMGGEGWQIYTLRCDDVKLGKEYEESFKGEFVEMPCGQKAIIYSVCSEVSEIVNIVKRLISNQPIRFDLRREMTAPIILATK